MEISVLPLFPLNKYLKKNTSFFNLLGVGEQLALIHPSRNLIALQYKERVYTFGILPTFIALQMHETSAVVFLAISSSNSIFFDINDTVYVLLNFNGSFNSNIQVVTKLCVITMFH